ncbi:MAG: NADPH:quinone oxidoreductase family protein [Deltaproteobacteria bacterium]|nr:NADPH:quinone oxidoreductase family protein [Deltaproteobacteria bacterium]
MKTLLCKQFGPPESLVLEDVPPPQARAGQIVVEVKACGVNFPDVLLLENKYQFKPPLPFAPGGEISGVVKTIGEGVSGLSGGDRILASTGAGGFAEEIAIPASVVIKIPDAMDWNTAAAFLMTYGTSYYALKDRGRLQPGETLVVLGAAGGVGLAAVELGHAMGARVIAAASSEEKLAVCREHGADETIDYSKEDLKERMRALTDGNGADVVYDPVGGAYSEPAIRSTAWEGRFLVIGFAAGDIPRIPLNLTLLKGCQIIGVFWGAFVGREQERHRQNTQELFDLYTKGKIRPYVSSTYPLARGGEAIRELADRRAKGKVVVVI